MPPFNSVLAVHYYSQGFKACLEQLRSCCRCEFQLRYKLIAFEGGGGGGGSSLINPILRVLVYSQVHIVNR